jgi:ABC-2 type transport system ATP-binding protein
MSGIAAIETRGLTKHYGRVRALENCELSLPEGRVIALVGPNGAGKTTLLRLIVGLIPPTAGTMTVLGETAVADTASALAKVGFVAQEHPLYRRFRVSELLRMGRATNPSWDQVYAERRLAELEIPLDRRAGSLSGGQQSQVALVLALAKRPALLVLDEPLASLDPLARRNFLRALMTAVADDGVTVLFSSHVVTELQRVCDHLVLIDEGRIRLDGPIEELLDGHRLLVGPRNGHDEEELLRAEGVVTVALGARHTNLVTRTGGGPAMPGWQAHPLDLETLVTAYLERSQRLRAERLHEDRRNGQVPAR